MAKRLYTYIIIGITIVLSIAGCTKNHGDRLSDSADGAANHDLEPIDSKDNNAISLNDDEDC